MTTLKQAEANRRNAGLSTGPKTDTGRSASRMNALSHGLRAASPVVPGEDPAAWEEYREAMVADLAPVGVLEEELADRVALLAWRLRRVAGYEAGVVARSSDKAARRVRGDSDLDEGEVSDTPKRVTDALERVRWSEAAGLAAERVGRLLTTFVSAQPDDPFAGDDAVFLLGRLPRFLPEPDDDESDDFDFDDDTPPPLDPMTAVRHPRFLLSLDMPAELHAEPERWCGWTAGVIRTGVERIARSAKWPAARLLEQAARGAAAEIEQRKAEVVDLRARVEVVRQRMAEAEAAVRRREFVPVGVVDTVTRYEGHLQRQFTQTLHELERRQALRSSSPPQPPVAVDVNVHAADGVTLPTLGG